jgi:hypothetical protein
MADKSNEGASVLKRIKITKAQRTMFIFVCGASLILGVTAVLVIYFGKTIAFQNKLIKQKEIVVSALEADQKSLEGMSAQIDELSSSEYLESVATDRDSEYNCEGYTGINTTFESKTAEEAEKVRRCSSLRVINDAMPSTTKTISVDDVDSTTRVQIALIVEKAGIDNYESDDNGVSLEDASYQSSDTDSALIEPYSTFDLEMNMNGNLGTLKSFLSVVDKSIRNFDLRSATLTIKDGGVEFKGKYSAYYTNPVNLQVMKRTVCADEESDECKAAGGDQSVKDASSKKSGK